MKYSKVEYKKGTYYAEEGNFSAAGAADIHYRRKLDQPLLVSFAGGQDGYRRGLIATSFQVLDADDILVGGEYGNNDGPWNLKEGYRKASALAKYSHGDAAAGVSVTAMGYSGHWQSTDQIPRRAVDDGAISRFGSIDPTDGGETHRYSASFDALRKFAQGDLRANAYALDYKLDLVSNFTYDTDSVHGDQFEQYDKRRVYGGSLTYDQPLNVAGREGTLKSGLQVRDDEINPVGLCPKRPAGELRKNRRFHCESKACPRAGSVGEDGVLL